MSGHLIGCAGDLRIIPGTGEPDGTGGTPLPTSHKLALLAFADSADNLTHIGFAGYEGVQKWAVCSRGRAAELIRDLVTWGLLKPHKRGHRGQRAEYVVFPGGCCDLHRKPAEEPDVDVEKLAAAAGVSVDQVRSLLAAAAGQGTVVQDAGSAGSPQEKGSDAPDATRGNGSDAPDPNSPDVHRSAVEAVENAGKGPERVHGSRSIANAFTPSEENPLTPASGGTGCARHPNEPGANCRTCGTSPRQQAKARRRDRVAADAAARIAEQARRAEAAAALALQHDPAETARRAAKVRQAARSAAVTQETR